MIQKIYQYLRAQICAPTIGALTVLAFAPLQWFIFALITPALLERLIRYQGAKKGAWVSFLFGIGFFGVGVSWIFLSIHNYSEAPVLAALIITLLFVASLSGVLSVMGAIYGAITKRFQKSSLLLFPVLWVMFEFVRSWIFTGFPWLLLGYTLIDTPLQGFAPLVGVYGLSFLCVFIGLMIVQLFSQHIKQQVMLTGAIAVLCLSGLMLNRIEWTHPIGEPKVFGLVQGNIPQEIKWDRAAANAHFNTYQQLTHALTTSHIIVWPEAAYPFTLPYGKIPLIAIDEHAKQAHQSLITGVVIADNEDEYTNSVIAVGENADGRYNKIHLVPFGEYVPFHQWLGATFDWLKLPMNMTKPGQSNQPPITAQGLSFSPLICYEIVYPELTRLHALDSDVLLTVSNDTWFGRSLGPIQHMQMARMRALENGRMLVRATNNGITAITDQHGRIRHQAPTDVATTLTGVVQGYAGQTPIMVLGHDRFVAIILLILLGLQIIYVASIRQKLLDHFTNFFHNIVMRRLF